MKININTKIDGDRLMLVPYRRHHVEKYHEWMSDPQTQQLTASEPLSLDEEYEMQQSWQNDENKLTFIILNKVMHLNCRKDTEWEKEVHSMIGDVNVFFTMDNHNEAELDVMIGEKTERGYGYGKEAVYLMMFYSLFTFPHIDTFIVKIDESNEASIRMFEKLNFQKYDYMRAFKQVCMKFCTANQSENETNNNNNIIIKSVKHKLSSIKCVYFPNDILINTNYTLEESSQ